MWKTCEMAVVWSKPEKRPKPFSCNFKSKLLKQRKKQNIKIVRELLAKRMGFISSNSNSIWN